MEKGYGIKELLELDLNVGTQVKCVMQGGFDSIFTIKEDIERTGVDLFSDGTIWHDLHTLKEMTQATFYILGKDERYNLAINDKIIYTGSRKHLEGIFLAKDSDGSIYIQLDKSKDVIECTIEEISLLKKEGKNK